MPSESTTVSVVVASPAQRADGEFFDSTRARGRPFTFGLGEEQVIPGLEEAVVCLSVGERAKATIPAAKAYGAKGFPGKYVFAERSESNG